METSVSSTTKETDEANEITSSIKLKLVKNGRQYYIARQQNMQNNGNHLIDNNSTGSAQPLPHSTKYGHNNWQIMSQQVSGSYQQSMRFGPLPMWLQNCPTRPVYKPVNGQVQFPVPNPGPRYLVNSQMKDTNNNNRNVFSEKSLTKSNSNGNGFPLLKNCFQQKANYYNIRNNTNINNNNNIKNNNSINGSNFVDRNTSYLVQPESTCAIQYSTVNQSYIDDRSTKDPLIKQLLSKKSEQNTVSCSVRAVVPLNTGSAQVQQNNSLCVGCRLAQQSSGKTADNDIICLKQTNCVSTQTDPGIKTIGKNNLFNQMNAQQFHAWQMSRVMKAFSIFANDIKSKILYKERTTSSLTPNEELAIVHRLRLMWNTMSVEHRKEYFLRSEKDSFGNQATNSSDLVLPLNYNLVLPVIFQSDTQQESMLQNFQAKNYIQNFITSKRQKMEINSDVKTNSFERKYNYLADSHSTDPNNTVYQSGTSFSSEQMAPNTSTIDPVELNDLYDLALDRAKNKRSLFSDVEELARPHHNIKQLKPNEKTTTNITIATLEVTTTERSD